MESFFHTARATLAQEADEVKERNGEIKILKRKIKRERERENEKEEDRKRERDKRYERES